MKLLSSMVFDALCACPLIYNHRDDRCPTRSEVLDILKAGWAETYCEYIAALEKAGFEDLWRERILPEENVQIDKLENAFASVNTDAILETVSALKGAPRGTVTVYISLMSFPTSVQLHETAFLDAIHTNPQYCESCFLAMIAHELMTSESERLR